MRILGNAEFLWVAIGSSSGQGGDCRGLESRMFCSLRAFWNDLVLDRRGGKCQPLK